MARGNSCEINDLEFAEGIEKLFNDYVALFVKLHYPEESQIPTDAERREISLKLKEKANGITLLGLKRKRIKIDTTIETHHLAPSEIERRPVFN